MRLITVTLAVSLLALAACSSSSEGDGIHPDPAGSGSGSSGTQTGTGAGGSAPSNQNYASDSAWVRFQGEFNSDDQEPAIEGAEVPPPRRLVGCAVDAPEIGERVVYVERSDPASDGPPDRQFVMSFVATASEDRYLATATIHRLVDPAEWAGRCEAGTTLDRLGPVTDEEGCSFSISMDEASTEMLIKPPSDAPFPAGCVLPNDGDASTVSPALGVSVAVIEWGDEIVDGNGSTRHDPVQAAPNDYASTYKMSRRTEAPEFPAR